MPKSAVSKPRSPADRRLDKLRRLRELQGELAELATPLEPWTPEAHQVPPGGDWYLWLLLAGRGAGKTEACSRYVSRYARENPGSRIAIIAPTLGDARQACVEGDSGLKSHDGAARFIRAPEYVVRWPNGSRADLFGTHSPDDIERLRAGGNRHLVWAEELAAWRYLQPAWEQMELGLRLGAHPHVVASTTPKPKAYLRKLLADASTVVSKATTNDNPHLHPEVRRRFFARYEGTRLGRQELYGELLDDIEGALWHRAWFERDGFRVWLDRAPKMPRRGVLAKIFVALDPAGGTEEGDEQAITVAALGLDHRYYVIHSEGVRTDPIEWIKRAFRMFDHYGADQIIYEKNYGDAFLKALVNQTAQEWPTSVAHHDVSATRGKRTRAEPIAMLYEQGKVSHVGVHDVLEDQMANYTGSPGEKSPDRLDATVWALTELAKTPKGSFDPGPRSAKDKGETSDLATANF
jgi:phage terminase large subunit-like protein